MSVNMRTEAELIDQFRRRLEWARLAWLRVCQASKFHEAITNVEHIDPKELHQKVNLSPYHKSLQDVDFYIIRYDKDSLGDEELRVVQQGVDDDLLRQASTLQTCTTSVYMLHEKITEVLKHDSEVERVKWLREVIEPERVFIPEDYLIEGDDGQKPQVPVYSHDYIQVQCTGKRRIVVDLAGDQFGFNEWLYTKEDYDYNLAEGRDPLWWGARKEREEMEKHQENIAFKDSLDQVIKSCELAWAQRKITWDNILSVSEEDLEEMYQDLANEAYEAAKR
jgi:hypothetical protein